MNTKQTDEITDSFNEQIFLNKQFQQKICCMIDSMEFAYPNDGLKLEKTINLFLESSHKLLGGYMKKVLD